MAKKLKQRVIKWRHNPLKKEEKLTHDEDEGWVDPNQQQQGLMIFNPTINTNAIHTPFGVIPFDTERVFNCYSFTTNFDIDDEAIELIDNINGVEVLQVFSPYSGLIVIGEQFDPEVVQKDIEEQVCGKTVKEETSTKTPTKVIRTITKMRGKLDKEYQFWAILLTPNSKMKTIKTNEINETFNDDLVAFDDLARHTGSLLEKSSSLQG